MITLNELPSFLGKNSLHRIIIFGCPGSGKTTLARKLSSVVNLPVIHWDTEYWLPNWQKPPRLEWIEKMKELTAREQWIFEGTFSSTLGVVIDTADLVIFTDRSTGICLWRCLTRKKYRKEIPDGCYDQFSFKFLWWVVRFNRLKRPHLMELIQDRPNTLFLQSDEDYAVFLKMISKIT